jgi:hypothetical protein
MSTTIIKKREDYPLPVADFIKSNIARVICGCNKIQCHENIDTVFTVLLIMLNCVSD